MSLSYRAELDMFIELLRSIKQGPDSELLLRQFSHYHLSQLIDLLIELRAVKDREEARRLDALTKQEGRTIVEGFSEVDIKDAFSNALDKVSRFFSEKHDVSVTILGLAHLPKGGHRAVLEVHITDVKENLTEKIKGIDVTLKAEKKKAYYQQKDKDDKRVGKLVLDHFMETTGSIPYVPDYFMVNVDDVELFNHMLEREFFHSTHTLPKDIWNLQSNVPTAESPMPEIIVKIEKPKPEPK